MIAAFLLAVSVLYFWGFPLEGFHFSDFHFYSDKLPAFWGLVVVDPATNRLNWELLYHNEGLMALMYYLVHQVPLATKAKLFAINVAGIAVQLLVAVLVLLLLRRLVGSSRLFPFALLYLLYPFASANRYWQACTANHLAALFFVTSLLLFLRVDYRPGCVSRNLLFRIIPSLALLWLSIITVEFALLLSPLYVLLAAYYGNGKTLARPGGALSSPYPALACVFLITSFVPVFFFSGHNLTVFAYAARYRELAADANATAFLMATVTIFGNAALVLLSVLFANTLGMVFYPLASLLQHPLPSSWMSSPVELAGIALAAALGIAGLRRAGEAGCGGRDMPDYRFLLSLGLLWTVLAYLPFSLSFGYPRNVGPVADRINLLGAIGVVLCLGSLFCLVQDWLRARTPERVRAFEAGCGLLIVVLLLNIQLQKAVYVEAERKERTVIDAVLDVRSRVTEGTREPIFLLHRPAPFVTPRAQLRHALSDPSWPARVVAVGGAVLDRYFLAPPVPTGFHLEGIYWFWSQAFQFYADFMAMPRPVIYRLEEPFRVSENDEAYTLGYQPGEVWENPSDATGFRTYPKARYALLRVEIAEPSFRFGEPLEYVFSPYQGPSR